MPNKKTIEEFYRRFTHDWPPEFYTKEEMPKIAKKVADYFENAFSQQKQEFKRVVKEKRPYTGTSRDLTQKELGYFQAIEDILKATENL